MKKCIKNMILKTIAARIRKKTKLSKIQSYELAATLVNCFYSMNGLHFRRNKIYTDVMFNGLDWRHFSLTEEYLSKQIGTVKQLPRYREPIGLWYTINSEETYTDAPKIQNTDQITYYASGREPLLAVANYVAPERKVVLLPYFTCGTVFQPFLENNWKIIYYKVDTELRLDTKDVEALYEKYQPSIAVFMEYSGMDLTEEELQTIGKLKRSGCVTIVDRSQNHYSQQQHKEVDFYFCSLRKWYPCPDGGYLKRNGDIPLPPAPTDHNDVYATTCAAMMFANGLASKTKATQYLQLARFFRKVSSAYVCCQPVRERSMSEYSKAVYFQEKQKDSLYMQQRKANFEYISQRIEGFTSIRPVCSDKSRLTAPPFYFHIYADNRKRLCQYLTTKGIMSWIFWNKPKGFGTLDDDTEYIFAHIVPLPCDQRYCIGHMKALCNALEEYEKEFGTSTTPPSAT